MYIHDTTEEQKTYAELQALFPNSSLPTNSTEVIATDWFYVHPINRPAYDPTIEKVEEIAPVKDGAMWLQTWQVVPLTQPEIDALLLEAKDRKYDEIWEASDAPKQDAEATFLPQRGQNPQRNNDLLNKKHSKIGNKKFKAQPLSPEGEAFDDQYDEYLDYADSVDDKADLECDVVEAMTNTNDVENYDVNNIVWPVWTP